MTKINLLPKEAIIKEEGLDFTILIFGAALIIILICSGLYFLKVGQKKSVNEEIVKVDAELKRLEDVIKQIDSLNQQKADVERKLNLIISLVKYRLVYPQLMEDVAKLFQEYGWLTSFVTRSAGQTTTLEFSIIAFDNYAVANLLETLESSKDLYPQAELQGGITTMNIEGKELKQIRITCNYKNKETPK